MRQKAGSFYRIKNKKEGRIEPRIDLVYGDWLAEYKKFLVKQSIYKT